jgi:hypothetical protein
MQTTKCKNCNDPIIGNFCPNCGQSAVLKRINRQYIVHEIKDFFFANKGMIYTVKKMLVNPGGSTKQYISENRFLFVKPITFLIITSLIYTLISYLFGFTVDDFHVVDDATFEYAPTAARILEWMVIDYPGYANIIMAFFIAFWIKLFFRKAGYNIFEIFILLCFITGITTLYTSLTVVVQGITHWNLVYSAGFIAVIYTIWAIGHFFDKKKVKSYIKATLSYLLGWLVFGIIIAIITAIDMVRYFS